LGLYRGHAGREEIFAREGQELRLTERRALAPGDFYAAAPARATTSTAVRTTSAETSVSIHLLTNDTGCGVAPFVRSRLGEEHPFRSGYVNVPCEDDE
jgi:hypothetical protein